MNSGTAEDTRELLALFTDVFGRGCGDDHPTLDRALWNTLREVGAARLTADEAVGGSGAGWTEAALLLGAAGAHAASLPLAENDLLALPLLDAAGVTVAADDTIRSVAVLDSSGTARDVPWARDVDRIAVAWSLDGRWLVADVPREKFSIIESTNHAREPRDHLRIDLGALSGADVDSPVVESLRYRGALARSSVVAGALERILDLVVEHTTGRTQFGRPLAKFQAVQRLAADIATETALTRAAVDAAVAAVDRAGFDDPDVRFAVAAARSCSGHAAGSAARNAHQAFGAIGFTEEHSLHRYTNRVLAWRSEYGSTRSWDETLTAAVVAAGGEGLWAAITRT